MTRILWKDRLTKNARSNGGIALVPRRLISAISSAAGGTHVLIQIVPRLVSPLVKILSISEGTAVSGSDDRACAVDCACAAGPTPSCANREHTKIANATRHDRLN